MTPAGPEWYIEARPAPPPRHSRRVTGGLGPGWIGWLAIAFVWLLATSILRREGDRGTAVEVAQLVTTVALLPVLATLLELASAEFGPGAGDNASGVAAGIAVARALQARPPRNLTPELLLQGASDQTMTGLRRYLHARRKTRGASNTVVLGIAPAEPASHAGGSATARSCRDDAPGPSARSAGRSPRASLRSDSRRIAAAARRPRSRRDRKRIPGTTIGCLDERGLAPRSHLPSDLPEYDRSASP